MKQTVVKFLKTLAVLTVLVLLFTVWDLRQARRTAEKVCAYATAGRALDEVAAFAVAEGCRIIPTTQGAEQVLMAVPKRGMGRHCCLVYHRDGKVTASRLLFQD